MGVVAVFSIEIYNCDLRNLHFLGHFHWHQFYNLDLSCLAELGQCLYVPVYPVSEDHAGATLAEHNDSNDDKEEEEDDGDNDDDDIGESQVVNTGCASRQPPVEAGILFVFLIQFLMFLPQINLM